MIDTPSREILWNVNSSATVFGMYSLMALSLIVASAGIFRRVEIWNRGPSKFPCDNIVGRIKNALTWAALQKGVVKENGPGLMHTLIYFGFLVLLFTTTMVFLDHDLGIEIYHGDFYLFVTVISDVFGAGLFVGCLMAAHRRYIEKADRVHSWNADSILIFGFALLVAQGFLLEGLRIHVTDDPWKWYSPVGALVANFFWGMSASAASKLHFLTWWFHTITVFSFLAILPYTKLFHIVSSSSNLFMKQFRPRGELSFPGDLMALMESGNEFSIGLGSLKDYGAKERLDLDACTSCGRCQDACPAYRTGKPLSPKWMVLDTRNHMLSLATEPEFNKSSLPNFFAWLDRSLLKMFLWTSGLVKTKAGFNYGTPSFRSKNELVQKSALNLGGALDDKIAGDVMDKDVFWSCTTCMACVEACPVGINHVDLIVGNRRHLALMEGDIPSEAQGTLRALEGKANPYGDPADRVKWLDGLNVKILEPGDSVDYLYWVGCVSAYDPRKQKIARALTKIMNKAGLSFGILGTVEGCTGDPARRLGEENLFQSLAKQNIETLKSIKFHTLVANCPHCFNTIKNEYPALGNLGDGRSPEIIHHSVLLKKLLAEEKIKLKDGAGTITLHDPCYLGRYNGEYDAPRAALRGVKGLEIIEMEESKERAMCCGAGGGHFWMDLKIGTRVNSLRTDHAANTGASTVATACPFCMQMLEDGAKLTNREESLTVKDIAEVMAEHLCE